MKFVNALILFALGLISFVMIRLLFSGGIELPERPMVKWSQVQSLETAGEKLGRFLFPMLKKQQALCFSGEAPEGRLFAQALTTTLKGLGLAIPVGSWGETLNSCYEIHVLHLGGQDHQTLCQQQGLREACVAHRANKKLKSKLKGKDPTLYWMSLYQVEEKRALFLLSHKEAKN